MQGTLRVMLPLKNFRYTFVRGVFRALHKIFDGSLFENSERLLAVNYFRKKLHCRCDRSKIRLCLIKHKNLELTLANTFRI